MSCIDIRYSLILGLYYQFHFSGVWGLKKNFALIELLERLSITKLTNDNNEFTFEEVISYVKCDEDESHHAEVYCTTCFTSLCQQCASETHKSKTLSKHKQIPISERPKVNPPCLLHPSHMLEFACLEDMCREQPLMCYICKDYGKHKGHKHVLIENEAENIRKSIINAVQHVNVFSGEVTEFGRKLLEITEKIEGQQFLPH